MYLFVDLKYSLRTVVVVHKAEVRQLAVKIGSSEKTIMECILK